MGTGSHDADHATGDGDVLDFCTTTKATTTATTTTTTTTTSATTTTPSTSTTTATTTTPSTSTTTTISTTTSRPPTTTTRTTTTAKPTTTTAATTPTTIPTTTSPTTTTSTTQPTTTTTDNTPCVEVQLAGVGESPEAATEYTRSSTITVSATVSTASCTNTPPQLDYSWTLTDSSQQEIQLSHNKVVSSQDELEMLKNFLDFGSYDVTYTTWYPDVADTEVVVSGYLSVISSALRAAIQGGSKVTRSGSFVLDAAGSQDPDVTGEGGGDQGLEYTWSVVMVTGGDNTGLCTGQAQDGTYSVTYVPEMEGLVCEYTVEVTKGDRSSTTSTTVTLTGPSAPTLSLSIVGENSKDDCVKVHLVVKLQTVCAPECSGYNWFVQKLTQTSQGGTDVSVDITKQEVRECLAQIQPDQLVGNTQYRVGVSSGEASVEETFYTCPVPKLGTCTTNIQQGVAVQDQFQVTCDHWYDDDFPDDPNIRLWYSAWYSIPEGDPDQVMLHEGPARGIYQTDTFLLPEGEETTGYKIILTVYIGATRGGRQVTNIEIKVEPNKAVNVTLINEGVKSANPLVVQRTAALSAVYSTEVEDGVTQALITSTKTVTRPNMCNSAATIRAKVAKKSSRQMKDSMLDSMTDFSTQSEEVMSKYGAFGDIKGLVTGNVECLGTVWVEESICSEPVPYPQLSEDPSPKEQKAAKEEYEKNVAERKQKCAERGSKALRASDSISGTMEKSVVSNEQSETCTSGLCMIGAKVTPEELQGQPLKVMNSSIKVPPEVAAAGLSVKMMGTENNTLGGGPTESCASLTLTHPNGTQIAHTPPDKPFIVRIAVKQPPEPQNVSCQGSRLINSSDSLQTVMVIADRGCNISCQVGDRVILSESYIPRESAAYTSQFDGEVRRLVLSLIDYKDIIEVNGNVTLNISMEAGVDWRGRGERPPDAMLAHSSAKCVYWNEMNNDWATDGLTLHRDTSMEEMVCACTHLTLFSSSFVVPPNTIDFSTVFDNLDQKLLENIHVVLTVIGIIVVYVVAIVFLRRKDKQDLIKWGIAPLADNLPADRIDYHLSVHTAPRSGAATRSNVYFVLAGEMGETEVRKLETVLKKRLTRGSVHRYILSVPQSLGSLLYIRIWHDNTGRGQNASWFLDRVVVRDVANTEKYVFLCNRWLAVDRDDGQIERLLPVATLDDLKTFQFLFRTTARKDLSDGHLWFSLLSRPTYSKFTRVQRLSCCLALLYATMIANAMWYKSDDNIQGTQYVRIGPLEFTPQQVFISIASSLVSIPVSVLIVFLFRRSRARPPKTPKITPTTKRPSDAEVADIDPELNQTSDYGGSNSTINAEAAEDVSNRQSDGSQIEVREATNTGSTRLNSTRDMKDSVTEDTRVDMDTPSGDTELQPPTGSSDKQDLIKDNEEGNQNNSLDENTKQEQNSGKTTTKTSTVRRPLTLPWWCIYIAWFLVVLTVAVSGFFTILYSFEWGQTKSLGWLTSFILSFFQSIIIVQPLKVLALAMVVALIFKQPPDDEDDFTEQDFKMKLREEQSEVEVERPQSACGHRVPYQQKEIDDNHLENMRIAREKELRMFGICKEITIYVIYLVLICVLIYDSRDPNSFQTKHELSSLFNVDKFNKAGNKGQLFTWMETFLVPNLYAERWYNDDPVHWRLEYFLSDLYYFRVGSPRLRLARVKQVDCLSVTILGGGRSSCYPEYSITSFDHNDYTMGWIPPSQSLDTTNISSATTDPSPTPWVYRRTLDLGGAPTLGKLTVYGGGGYVADLGPDMDSATEQLQHLKDNTWLDRAARAVFIEFNVINPSTKLFTMLTFISEFPATGGIINHVNIKTIQLYSYVGAKALFVIILQLLFVAFTVYFIVLMAKRIKVEGKVYLKSKWNMLELASIITACVSCVMYGIRFIMVRTTINKFHQDKAAFLNFTYVIFYDEVYSYVLGFLVFLAMLKLLRLIRFNQKVTELMTTLEATVRPLLNFLMFFSIVYLAFAQFGFLVFGRVLADYSTIVSATESLLSIMLMNFSFDDLRSANPVLGPIFFFLFILVVAFIVMNMFLAILNEAYSAMQASKLMTSSDAEMVEYMLQQFKGLLGFVPLPSGQDEDDEDEAAVAKTKGKPMNKDQCKEFFNSLENAEKYKV